MARCFGLLWTASLAAPALAQADERVANGVVVVYDFEEAAETTIRDGSAA